jgi:transglutaminase-like putative cysteine protease
MNNPLRAFLHVHTLDLLLLGILVALPAASFAPHQPAASQLMLLAFAAGLLLAISHASPRTALAWNILVSFFLVCLVSAGILSSPGTLREPSQLAFWQNIHLHLAAFLNQVKGWLLPANWVAWYRQPATVDGAMLSFLLSLFIWQLIAWLAWSVLRRKRALEGALLPGALLAFSISYNDQNMVLLIFYILCTAALAALNALQSAEADWEARHKSYPGDLGFDWTFFTLLSIMLVAAAAWLAPLAGTPQGWQKIQNFFNPPTTSASGILLFEMPPLTADIAGLERIGSGLPSSGAVVLWLHVSDPPPEVFMQGGQEIINNPQPYYLRSQVYTRYTGQGWQPALRQEEPAPALPTASQPQPGRSLLEQQIEILPAHGEQLFAANAPFQSSQGTRLRLAGVEGSLLLEGSASQYTVSSWVANLTQNQLEGAGANYPAEILEAYLQLPPDLPGRVYELADALTRDLATPYQKALAVQNYLRSAYPYRPDAALIPPGEDAVDHFLFESQEGFCSHFSSAMAVLLRATGVPVRVVSGYIASQYDVRRQAYRIPASAAHTWVEVYFPGYGWVEFEPTPSQPARQYGAQATGFPTGAPLSTGNALPGRSPLLPGLLSAAGLALLGLGWFLLSRRNRNWPALPPAARLYWQVRAVLQRGGPSLSSANTPAETEKALLPLLAGHTLLQHILQEATALYIAEQFSPHPPSKTDLRQVRRLWHASWPQRLLLRSKWRPRKTR